MPVAGPYTAGPVSPGTIANLVQGLVIMILSLSVHEWAHAYTAYRLGDDTAARLGRLTLNPLAHIDPIGTLLIPAFGALSGVPVFGWANPVPVNPLRFRRDVNMWRGMAWTAAAGPASNFVMAILGAALLRLLVAFLRGSGSEGPLVRAGLEFLFGVIQVNVMLGLFNLLPIPPLDGSRLLPRSLDRYQAIAGRYSFLLLMLVIATPVGTPLFLLVRLATSTLTGFALG